MQDACIPHLDFEQALCTFKIMIELMFCLGTFFSSHLFVGSNFSQYSLEVLFHCQTFQMSADENSFSYLQYIILSFWTVKGKFIFSYHMQCIWGILLLKNGEKVVSVNLLSIFEYIIMVFMKGKDKIL